jgi:hypothetical protein
MRKAWMIAVLMLMGGMSAKDAIVYVPGHCVLVDQFYNNCPASRYGGYDCKVHIIVRPLPECAEFDHQRFLQVSK